MFLASKTFRRKLSRIEKKIASHLIKRDTSENPLNFIHAFPLIANYLLNSSFTETFCFLLFPNYLTGFYQDFFQ